MRAKNHDQRKGQWLINKIRNKSSFIESMKKVWDNNELAPVEKLSMEKSLIELRLWNMENHEFDDMMRDYDE